MFERKHNRLYTYGMRVTEVVHLCLPKELLCTCLFQLAPPYCYTIGASGSLFTLHIMLVMCIHSFVYFFKKCCHQAILLTYTYRYTHTLTYTCTHSYTLGKNLCVQLYDRKHLADVSTKCSSHLQGESEARCQNIHLSTAAHSRIHMTGGRGMVPASPSPEFPYGSNPAAWHLVAFIPVEPVSFRSRLDT